MILLTETEKETNPKNSSKMQIETCPEGQVTIHVLFQACFPFCKDCGIVVHPDFHLIPDTGLKKSGLIHIENRSSSLTFNIDGEFTRFTLFFSALPKSCSKFDLIEPGAGGWRLLNIERNSLDVYYVKFHSESSRLLNTATF